MGQQVEVARREGIDQLVREGGDLRSQGRDPARGEGAQHQPAQAFVGVAVQFQHRMVVDGVEGGQVRGMRPGQFGRDLAAEAAILQKGLHGLVAEGGHHAVVFPELQRGRGPGPGIDRVGVLDKGGIGRGLVQRHAAI